MPNKGANFDQPENSEKINFTNNHYSTPSVLNPSKLQDGQKTFNNLRYETVEQVEESFIFEENLEDDIDEEEEILYLDQNNQIIRRHDQPLDNPSKDISNVNKRPGNSLIPESLGTQNNKICSENIKTSQRTKNKLENPSRKLEIHKIETIPLKVKEVKTHEVEKNDVADQTEDLQAQESLSPSKIFSASGPQYRKKQSKVWTHFEKSSDGAHVICNSCGEVQRFMSNTTNMIRHIEKVHSNKAKSEYNEPSRRVKQLRRKVCQRSPVWSFFHRMSDLPKVQCKLCLENYTYSGNTTNLRFHMRTRHPEEYKSIEDEQQTTKEKKKSDKDNVDIDLSLKKLNADLVIGGQCETKTETISVEVCNLESGDLGGPVYVATAPTSYLA